MKTNATIIKVSKIGYLCDLGNIETIDGRRVKKNLLFRSSVLNKINDETIEYLKNDLKIDRIVDLRTKEEAEYKKDKVLDDFTYCHYPLLTEADNPTISRKNRKKVIKKMIHEGGTKKFLCNVYRKLVSSDLAIEGYKMMFRDLLYDPRPTLWHCTQGKDRTGMQTLMILLALGVDKETIINDYLSYNHVRRLHNFFILFGVSFIALKPRIAKHLSSCIRARRTFLEEAFDEFNTRYGSFKTFWNETLEFSDEELELLKDLYLE